MVTDAQHAESNGQTLSKHNRMYTAEEEQDKHLQVLLGVPVMLQEDDSVSRGEVEAQPSHMGRQQQHLNGWVTVEALHYAEALLCLHTAVYKIAKHVTMHYTVAYASSNGPQGWQAHTAVRLCQIECWKEHTCVLTSFASLQLYIKLHRCFVLQLVLQQMKRSGVQADQQHVFVYLCYTVDYAATSP